MWTRSSYTNVNDTQLHSAMRLTSGCLQPTQLSWLSNVAPHSLRRKAASDNMLQIIIDLCMLMSLSIHLNNSWLASQRPIWSDMTSVDTVTQWREDCSSSSVVNHTVVTDATMRQPVFGLPRHTSSSSSSFYLLNNTTVCTFAQIRF